MRNDSSMCCLIFSCHIIYSPIACPNSYFSLRHPSTSESISNLNLPKSSLGRYRKQTYSSICYIPSSTSHTQENKIKNNLKNLVGCNLIWSSVPSIKGYFRGMYERNLKVSFRSFLNLNMTS